MTNRPTSFPTNAPAALTFTIGARTDKGMQRSANEDAVALLDVPGADASFVVADGMGGLRAGDVASNEAVRVVELVLKEKMTGETAWEDPFVALSEAFTQANDAVNGLAKPTAEDSEDATQNPANPAPSNALMGTTCVVGLVRGTQLYLAHVGDSRAYLYRDGELSRLTHDHSFVADRVRAGDMTEAEARNSRFRNMITRAIGIDTSVEPDFRQETLLPGDTVISCSDGLTTMMEDEEIEELLSSRNVARLSPERAASTLVDAANKKGGSDNITVVLLRAHLPGQETAIAAPTTPASSASKNSATPKPAVTRDKEAPPARTRANANNRRGGASPFTILLAILGLAAVAGVGALAASPELRQKTARILSPKEKTLPVDFTNLGYESPEKFGPDYLTRGDLLSYSPEGGLYFVAAVSGKVANLSLTKDADTGKVAAGVVEGVVANLPPAPPPPLPLPETRVFFAADPDGNLYVSHTKGKYIEKKNSAGKTLLTLKGLDQPEAIAIDQADNLYVDDFNQIKILRAKPNALAIQKKAEPTPAASPAAKKPGSGK